MKVDYAPFAGKKTARLPITAKEQQVIYDHLTRKVGAAQAMRTLGIPKANTTYLYYLIVRVARYWVENGIIDFKKKDF